YLAHRAGADHFLRIPDELDDLASLIADKQSRLISFPEPAITKEPALADATGRVLIIDDTETNRVLATRQLRQLGLASDTAQDGREGLDKAAGDRYATILVDDQMPVMDGAEFIRRWRAFEAANGRSRTPVIAMTAHAQVGDRERYLSIGADDYL